MKSGRSNCFRVGAAQVDITPEAGSLMACFPQGPEHKSRRSKGIHDPLKAKAVVLSDKQETICLCSCDLTMIQRIDVERIRKLVSRQIISS